MEGGPVVKGAVFLSGLVIDVADLKDHPGATKTISRAQPVSGLRGVLGWVGEEEDVSLELTASSVVEGIEVEGEVSGTMHLACSRCLSEFQERFNYEVDETFYSAKPKESEGYEIEANKIDLEPMVRDLVVLSIPFHPLHSPDCRGLCPVCGADRNVVDCGHNQDFVDSGRWAPLEGIKDLLKRGEK